MMNLVIFLLVALEFSENAVKALEFSSRMRPSTKLMQVPPAAQLEAATTPKVELNALDLCLAGAFATAFGDFVMHPIDTIKITQQTAVAAKGMLGTLNDIIAQKGIFALYQGVVPYLVGDGLSGAVKFAIFELANRFVEKRLPEKYIPYTRFLCAALAMLICSVILVPGEVLKTRLQAGSGLSLIEVVKNILGTEGIRGLFVGYYATLVRDIPYTMLELGIYENLKVLLSSLQVNNEEVTAAAVTGAVSAFITTPLDLVKTKLMIQTSAGGQYAGVMDAISSIYSSGGVKALFVGSLARVAWLLPFTTIYLQMYERCKRFLLVRKSRKSQIVR